MRAPRPDRVDVETLAAQGASIQRRFSLGGFSRLKDLLAAPGGEARARLTFAPVAKGVVACELVVDAVATLQCQRCLEPFEQALNSTARLAFVASDDDAALVPEGYEAMPAADGQADLAALVEDELLLSLPIVALHGSGTPCAAETGHRGRETREPAEAKTHRPFAQLQELLKH
jgi:uncharacterized protein